MWWLRRAVQGVAGRFAVALAQIGEFSFILATLGRELGLFTTEATNTIVAASIVSIVVNPLLYPGDRADRRVGRRAAGTCAIARSAASHR